MHPSFGRRIDPSFGGFVSVDLTTGVERAKGSSSRHDAHFGFRFVMPLALGSTLNPINSTMISTALVAIAGDYHASVAQTGWLIAGLYLTSAIAQPTMGRLADLFGPRRVYLFSLCVVALAGIAGAIAPSLGMLIGVRVLHAQRRGDCAGDAKIGRAHV